jgi:hypothetical protein
VAVLGGDAPLNRPLSPAVATCRGSGCRPTWAVCSFTLKPAELGRGPGPESVCELGSTAGLEDE